MILVIYSSVILCILLVGYILGPNIFKLINYNYWIPKEIILNSILTLIISLIFIGFHIQSTQEACQKINGLSVFFTWLKTFIILEVWVNLLDYYPSIIQPFIEVTGMESDIALSIFKTIMIFAVVHLLLIYTGFQSVKDTCKANIEQIKQAYKQLEKEVVST